MQVYFQNAFHKISSEVVSLITNGFQYQNGMIFVGRYINPSWATLKKMLFLYQSADSQHNFSHLSHQTFCPYVCLPLEASQILSWRKDIFSGAIHSTPAFSACKHAGVFPSHPSHQVHHRASALHFPWQRYLSQLSSRWMLRGQPAVAFIRLCFE